jgi:hypothetical protein
MNISRWLLSTCLGMAAVCCGLHLGLPSRNPRSAPDSRTHPPDLTNVFFQPERAATAADRTAAFQALPGNLPPRWEAALELQEQTT